MKDAKWRATNSWIGYKELVEIKMKSWSAKSSCKNIHHYDITWKETKSKTIAIRDTKRSVRSCQQACKHTIQAPMQWWYEKTKNKKL